MAIPAPNGVDASAVPPAGDQATAVLSGRITAVGPAQNFAFRGPMNLVIYASINTTLTTTANTTSASVGSGTGLAAGVAINSVNLPAGTTYGTFSGTSGNLAFPTLTLYGNANTVQAQISGLNTTAGLLNATVTGPGIPSGTTVIAIPVAAVAASLNSQGVPGTVQLSNIPTIATPNGAFNFALTNSCVTAGADTAAIFTGAGVSYSATVQLERSFDGGSTWIVCNIGGSGTLAQWTAGTPVSLTFGEPERNVLYRLNCIAYTSGTINYRISQTGGAAESLAIGPLTGG
jgi:hypothetical protein